MFRKADREKLRDVGFDAHNCNCSLTTVMAQLKSLAEGQDKLLQSHAALEAELTTKPNRIDLAATHEALNRLNEFVGSNQAVLDTLVQTLCDQGLAVRALLTALERKVDGHTENFNSTNALIEKCFKNGANGKRKR